MYTVAFLQIDNLDPLEMSLSHELECLTPAEIVSAVEALCFLISYNPENMMVDYTELRDSYDQFTDNNYVLLELFGSNVIVDIIVGKTSCLRKRFPLKESVGTGEPD